MAEEETQNAFDRLVITRVQVYPLKDSMSKTRAVARVVVNEQLQLTGLRVVEGSNDLFVSCPNDHTYKGEDYRPIFYSLTREFREHIEEVVLAKYHETIGN